MRIKALHTALLLMLGFVSGALGIALFTGNSPVVAESSHLLASVSGVDACVPDTKSEEDDIFFLSCGGIF
jgi:hypothetical protein